MKTGEKITIFCSGIIYIYDFGEILYFGSDDCYTTVYLENGKEIVIIKSLAKVERDLNNNQFIRINQSYLVNKDFITSIDKKKKLALVNGVHHLPFTITVKKFIELLINKPFYLNAKSPDLSEVLA